VGETFPEAFGITAPPDTEFEPEPALDGMSEPEAGAAVGPDAKAGMTEPPDNVEDPVTWPVVIGRATPLLLVADPTTIGELPEPAVGVAARTGTREPPDNVEDPVT